MNAKNEPQPRVVASIEARMGSSRLPGKVLADIGGVPAVARLVKRLRFAQLLDDIVLATTDSPLDDDLERWARKERVPCYRGSEGDVLQRVVEAQAMMDSDVVVEVTGDCVLLDPELVDMAVMTFLNNECDVVTNLMKASYPMGMDLQVFPFAGLLAVAERIRDPAVREHVSLYFYEHPEEYRIINLFAPARWHAPDYRFQLDYPEDLEFLREVYKRLEGQHDDQFGLEEIMSLLRCDPSLLDINRHCVERPIR